MNISNENNWEINKIKNKKEKKMKKRNSLCMFVIFS